MINKAVEFTVISRRLYGWADADNSMFSTLDYIHAIYDEFGPLDPEVFGILGSNERGGLSDICDSLNLGNAHLAKQSGLERIRVNFWRQIRPDTRPIGAVIDVSFRGSSIPLLVDLDDTEPRVKALVIHMLADGQQSVEQLVPDC